MRVEKGTGRHILATKGMVSLVEDANRTLRPSFQLGIPSKRDAVVNIFVRNHGSMLDIHPLSVAVDARSTYSLWTQRHRAPRTTPPSGPATPMSLVKVVRSVLRRFIR